jgi:hypothetical protein
MDNPEKKFSKKLSRWIVILLPVGAAIVSAFLPLSLILRQLMIVVVLVWFQLSLMYSFFTN